MTTKTPAKAVQPIEIHLREGLDYDRINSFLLAIFGAWEKGRTAVENGNGGRRVECDPKIYAEIHRTTFEFLGEFAGLVVKESAPAIGNAYYAQGVEVGFHSSWKKIGEHPSLNGQMPAPMVNGESLVKSIAEELLKAYDAGLSVAKSSVADTPPRVTSARQFVQRNQNTGEIQSTVVHYQYEDAPGVQPPPL
jgi:hypothetical protein